jgi:S1-C subfamily serine protease
MSATELQTVLQTLAPAVRAVTVSLGQDRRASGIVFQPGVVVTNAHALRNGTIAVTLPDDTTVQGAVVGVDVDGDLAVITVDTGSIVPLAWAESAPIPGSLVVAAHGRGPVSLGMVSSTGLSFRGPRGSVVSGSFEHTAPLAPGASGGPVVDLDGSLVGIDTARSDAGYRAITANPELYARIEKLAAGESVEPRQLGVALAPAQVARQVRKAAGLPELDGLLVRSVMDDSLAATAGIAEGDLLVAVNVGGERQALSSPSILGQALRSGNPVELVIVRGVDERTVTV